eukprot:8908571-Alexandrium_andersonii.AAC.1
MGPTWPKPGLGDGSARGPPTVPLDANSPGIAAHEEEVGEGGGRHCPGRGRGARGKPRRRLDRLGAGGALGGRLQHMG